MIGVRDFIVPFHLDGPKHGQRGDLKWVDTTGYIAEWTPEAGPAAKLLGNGLAAVGQTLSLAGAMGAPVDMQAAGAQVERAGAALDNLSKLGNHWWAPMAAEIAGAVVGGGIGAGILGASGSSVETSFGIFGWGAYRHEFKNGETGQVALPGNHATPTVRSRIQVNVDKNWNLGF